jgi:selenocysteine-specific translation elongation factor
MVPEEEGKAVKVKRLERKMKREKIKAKLADQHTFKLKRNIDELENELKKLKEEEKHDQSNLFRRENRKLVPVSVITGLF